MKFFIVLSAVLAVSFASIVSPIVTKTHSQDEFGQYHFGYSEPLSSKQELRTIDGVTRGAYSYVDANGQLQSVSYTADALNGFRAVGTNIPSTAADVVVEAAAPAVACTDCFLGDKTVLLKRADETQIIDEHRRAEDRIREDIRRVEEARDRDDERLREEIRRREEEFRLGHEAVEIRLKDKLTENIDHAVEQARLRSEIISPVIARTGLGYGRGIISSRFIEPKILY